MPSLYWLPPAAYVPDRDSRLCWRQKQGVHFFRGRIFVEYGGICRFELTIGLLDQQLPCLSAGAADVDIIQRVMVDIRHGDPWSAVGQHMRNEVLLVIIEEIIFPVFPALRLTWLLISSQGFVFAEKNYRVNTPPAWF